MKIRFGNHEITLLEINKISMKVSIALATYDGEGTRHKAGDIIAVKPAGWQWGRKEVKEYLIAEVELPGISSLEEAEKLQLPLYENGTLDPEGNEVIIGKRRFQLPLEEIEKTIPLDREKLVDKGQEYQPLKDITLTSPSITDKVKAKVLDPKTIKNG